MNGSDDNRLNDDDIVASNNDINITKDAQENDISSAKVLTSPEGDKDNKKIDDLLISNDVTPKIYEDIYEDFVGTLTKKKDPADDDDSTILKNKDEIPEKKQEKTDEEDEEQHADDSEDDVDSISTDTTITGTVDVTVAEQPQSSSDSSDLIARIKEHINKLEQLRDSTTAKEVTASGEVAALKEQLERASCAADHAVEQSKTLRGSLLGAESSSCSRAAVVSELQQSTARLGAAGHIIRQQLEQLNAELVQQKQVLVQERSDKHQLQGMANLNIKLINYINL